MFWAVWLGSFLVGGIPFGLILVKWRKGVDVRRQGSSNIGATNVLRLYGRGLGGLTLLFDVSKGAVPVWLSRDFFRLAPAEIAVSGCLAFLGHLYSPYLGWKGGKGVSTAVGVISVLCFPAAIAATIAFATLFLSTGWVSVGSLCGALIQALWFWTHDIEDAYRWLSLVLLVGIVFRHRQNIQRIRLGTEPRTRL